MPKDIMILYCGDTALREAASYLAGVMAHSSLTFDYLASEQRFNDDFLFRAYRGIILSDYPAINFNPGQMEKLKEWVDQGMGFLMIGGWPLLQERIENTPEPFLETASGHYARTR